jgi:hypothetical protein
MPLCFINQILDGLSSRSFVFAEKYLVNLIHRCLLFILNYEVPDLFFQLCVHPEVGAFFNTHFFILFLCI